MRMTKTIRDYITRTITDMYQKAFEKLDEKYGWNRDKQVFDDACKEAQEMVKTLLAEKLSGLYAPDELKKMLDEYRINIPYWWDGAMASKQSLEEEKAKLRKQRERAIENVILTMELGGTKADLDRMLAEIQVDV